MSTFDCDEEGIEWTIKVLKKLRGNAILRAAKFREKEERELKRAKCLDETLKLWEGDEYIGT